MKKLVAFILCMALVITCVACFAACNPKDEGGSGTGKVVMSGYNPETDGAMKVAMITDYGDITDQSFNQTTYEACKAFSEANSLGFKYFKPAGDSTEARVASVEQAIQEGYNVVVMPGYAFGETVVEVAEQNQNVTFIALDVAQGDLGDDYVVPGNVATFVYREEISGFMAGYAAVKLGYTHLGFLGGMAVPAVIRYGYGFVQGCNDAGKEMNDEITVEYVYGNKFAGTPEITAYMDTWYQEKGVQVVFACGGGIYTSATEAAKKANGKVIGVDTDQAATINKLGTEGMTVTSAMKGLGATVKATLKDVIENGNWANYGGKIATLGLVSGDDPELNYVQIPMESTQWTDTFTKDDYKALVKSMFDGTVKVSDDTSAMPAHSIIVNEYDNIM